MENKAHQTTHESVDITVQGIPFSGAYKRGNGALQGTTVDEGYAVGSVQQAYTAGISQQKFATAGAEERGNYPAYYTGPVSTPYPGPEPQKSESPGGIYGEGASYSHEGTGGYQQPEYSFGGASGVIGLGGTETMVQENQQSHPMIAMPPPHVMTALGPMPLPREIRNKIPEKFVAKPIIEEREIFVAKKEIQERTIEVPHVQYDHKFMQIPKNVSVKKLVPSVKEVIREIPREVYKPVIEEKVIEVPQGVKYVEVPVEVPCFYPPKIVPVPREHIVERVVETIKPVVQEKIIEVPQTVVKNVPKIKTVEVPYFVPRYVEKVIEVPYQPPANNSFLPLLSTGTPHSIHGNFPGQAPFSTVNTEGAATFPPSFAGAPSPFTLGPIPLSGVNEIRLPYEAKIDVHVTQSDVKKGFDQQQYFSPSSQATMPSHPEPSSVPIELPEGVQWGAPPNAPPLEKSAMPQFFDYPATGKIPPMMVTFPPEVGQISYSGKVAEPNILTRAGVMPYQGFKVSGNAQSLFPPLPPHSLVPMQNGIPDVNFINERAKSISITNPLTHNRGGFTANDVEASCNIFTSECCVAPQDY